MTFHKDPIVCRFKSTSARTAVLKNANGESENVAHYWTPHSCEKDGISRTIFKKLPKSFCSNHREEFNAYPLVGFVMGKTGLMYIASESVVIEL